MYWQTVKTDFLVQTSPDELYDYITQPHRWHEWHPASIWADTEGRVLKAGDTYNEKVHVLWLKSPMSYQVLVAERPKHFKVEFTSRIGKGIIEYVLEDEGSATRFKRTLAYNPKLWAYKYILFFIVRPFMRWQSKKAVANLIALLKSRS